LASGVLDFEHKQAFEMKPSRALLQC